MKPSTINVPTHLKISQEQFEKIARANPDMRLERTTIGELIIMPPTGGSAGKYNVKLSSRFVIWNEQTELGEVFDSSTAFRLPNGADRSPDVAWIRQDRWDTLTTEEKEKFPPIAPDFVLELMSPTDNLKDVQVKMREYMDNQVKLGWLFNPKTRRVEIYRLEQEVEVLQSPAQLFGEDILLGFVLNMQLVWDYKMKRYDIRLTKYNCAIAIN